MRTSNKPTASVCSGLTVWWTLLFAAAARAQGVSFEQARHFPAENGPRSVAPGDFNSDGYQDLAVANINSNDVSILLGNGDGSFQPARNFVVGSQPVSVAVGDFNGDGWQDLAVAYYGRFPADPGGVSVLLGNGDGSFQPASNFAAGDNPFPVVVDDFNGDGNLDLAVANFGHGSDDTVSILPGNGDGSFRLSSNFVVGGNPSSLAVGDFNNDGLLDLHPRASLSTGAYRAPFGYVRITSCVAKVYALPRGNEVAARIWIWLSRFES